MKSGLIKAAVTSRADANNQILKSTLGRYLTLAFSLIVAFASVNALAQNSILDKLGTPQVLSTVPSNGDLNPYGVAFVPSGFPSGGLLDPGDILVSNYNDNQNLQGTGSMIVDFRNGQQTLFFKDFAKDGLTTGLAVLKAGFVLVGTMPTTDGTSATVQPGSLIAINPAGQIVWTLAQKSEIDGPWDFTVFDQG